MKPRRVLQRNCEKVLEILSSNPDPVVDLFNLLNRFTLDSIGEIGFGTSIGSLENPVTPFLRSFDEAQRIVFRRFVLPGWRASVIRSFLLVLVMSKLNHLST